MLYKVLCLLFIITLAPAEVEDDWGFYGHRKINRMAVFTLPQELLTFYKPNIHFITEHAVDPDKRRYALKNEAYRHYIDIDHWDVFPFEKVPRDLEEAIIGNGSLLCITDVDTLDISSSIQSVESLYKQFLRDDRYSQHIELDSSIVDHLGDIPESCQTIYYHNPFVEYGVLPYFLEDFYRRLVKALGDKDKEYILKVSADMGHYIGDAHVPLHTTENYNGQLTNQLGIHAFWESRLPELFADDNYDMLVGKAEYIPDVKKFFWEVILESHELLPEVLAKEEEIKNNFPSDKQFCFDDRLEYSTWTQCPDFAKAYEESLGGMVEERMQDAVLALGSVWYSAWIDAGQPDLSTIDDNVDPEKLDQEKDAIDKAVRGGNIYGRSHGG